MYYAILGRVNHTMIGGIKDKGKRNAKCVLAVAAAIFSPTKVPSRTEGG